MDDGFHVPQPHSGDRYQEADTWGSSPLGDFWSWKWEVVCCSVWQNARNFTHLLCYHGQCSSLANTNLNWMACGVLLTHKPSSTARTSLPLTWSDVDRDADISWAGWHCKQGSGAGGQPPSLSLHSWTPSSSITEVPSEMRPLFQFLASVHWTRFLRPGGPSHAFHANSIVPCVMCQYFLFWHPGSFLAL